MNPSFDYNGHVVAPSKPQKVLRTAKKTIHIDSMDRDMVKYPRNGDFVVYLPRVYKNVVSIRLAGAVFPPLNGNGSPGAVAHNNVDNTDTQVSDQKYFFIELNGLNKTDETTKLADKSTIIDGYFAKINAPISNYYLAGNAETGIIVYSDKSDPDNIGRYTPPIENLDRLNIKCRLHHQQGNQGYIFWTDKPAGPYTFTNKCEFSLTLEIEYLENGFDEFSSFETRLGQR